MKTNKAILVAVSALALNIADVAPVFGQIVISCPQTLNIGTHASCSAGNLVINADGTTSLTGCLITTQPVQVGQCFLSTGGLPVTRSVRVDFPQAFVQVKNGTNQMLFDNFRMIHSGVGTSATRFTFSPTAVSGKVTIDIGGRVSFGNNQALGGYSGNIVVRADLI